jgi:hypothetical protein
VPTPPWRLCSAATRPDVTLVLSHLGPAQWLIHRSVLWALREGAGKGMLVLSHLGSAQWLIHQLVLSHLGSAQWLIHQTEMRGLRAC